MTRRSSFYFNVLYERMWIVIAKARRTKNALRAQCSATKIAQFRSVSHIRLIETTFTLRGIALCTRKFFIYGPSFGCSISHVYNLRLLRRNNADANSRKGVVGRTGRNIPNMPIPKASSPKIVRIICINVQILFYISVQI